MQWFTSKLENDNDERPAKRSLPITLVFYHEDDYCQIEIQPVENYGFCAKQAGLIVEFTEADGTKDGFANVYLRDQSPISLLDKGISAHAIEKALAQSFPKYDEVLTGYSTYREMNRPGFSGDPIP